MCDTPVHHQEIMVNEFLDQKKIIEIEDDNIYEFVFNNYDEAESCKSDDVDDSSHGSEKEEDDNYENDIYTEPILVGYAFGPKKMSTMGVVMAEASKTKLSSFPSRNDVTPRTIVVPPFDTVISVNTICNNDGISNMDDSETKDSRSEVANGLTKATLSSHELHQHTQKVSLTEQRHNKDYQAYRRNASPTKNKSTQQQALSSTFGRNDHIVFTIDGHLASSLDESASNNLRSIVRYFRSSCSSVGSEDASTATGTQTATSVTSSSQYTGTVNTVAANSSSNGSYSKSLARPSKRKLQNRFPVRVSFVPLDPDVDLDEQHGGKMDVILHKLTEDILCLSQLAMKCPTLKRNLQEKKIRCTEDTEMELDTDDKQAIQRILNVSNFHRKNPECCLVDDPALVLALMSRADIADTLEKHLSGVFSASGIPVGSPAYAVVASPYGPDENEADWLKTKVKDLTYPLIVKPLTAAGTKASHSMAVIMDDSALQKVVYEKAPCLLQEYSNHDATLYKVYVLGDHVSVHKRRSLPNLPSNTESILNYVDFDSQRPYPRLSDFGYQESGTGNDNNDFVVKKKRNLNVTIGSDPLPAELDNKSTVSVEEIMPLVDALKNAFGLELFGFDVLITARDDDIDDNENVNSTEIRKRQQRMLIIDVNYFPSYKEVTQFPALLAKYLTDRALKSRLLAQSQHS